MFLVLWIKPCVQTLAVLLHDFSVPSHVCRQNQLNYTLQQNVI